MNHFSLQISKGNNMKLDPREAFLQNINLKNLYEDQEEAGKHPEAEYHLGQLPSKNYLKQPKMIGCTK